MKKYILAFLAFIGLNFAGLFCLGFAVGAVMAIGGETSAEGLEQAGWFNLLIFFTWPVISFFAFKFCVQKIILKTKDEDSKLF